MKIKRTEVKYFNKFLIFQSLRTNLNLLISNKFIVRWLLFVIVDTIVLTGMANQIPKSGIQNLPKDTVKISIKNSLTKILQKCQ